MKKKIELPDIQEFLKLSRTFIRQLELIKNNKVPYEYKDIVEKTTLLVIEKVNSIKASKN